MGNLASDPLLDSQQTRVINHQKMKNIKFMCNNQIMRLSFNLENQQQFKKWEQLLSKLNNYDDCYLLLPKVYTFKKTVICSSSGVLQIDYDNYPFLLQEEVKNRMLTKRYFREVQLWYLLYGLVSAAKAFKKINRKVGDIQINNIFVNEEGQIKISNVCSWPSEHTNYEKLVFEHVTTYVAPQQLQWVKEGRVDIYNKGIGQCDRFVCESFSIGLTMLQCVLLNPSLKLYGMMGTSLNQQQLEKRVTKMLQGEGNNQYSKELKMIIAGLCEVIAEDRLISLQLYETLKYYDSQLTNLKPCTVKIPTLKKKLKYEQFINNSNKISNSINNHEYNYRASDSRLNKNQSYSTNHCNFIVNNNNLDDYYYGNKYNVYSSNKSTTNLHPNNCTNYSINNVNNFTSYSKQNEPRNNVQTICASNLLQNKQNNSINYPTSLLSYQKSNFKQSYLTNSNSNIYNKRTLMNQNFQSNTLNHRNITSLTKVSDNLKIKSIRNSNNHCVSGRNRPYVQLNDPLQITHMNKLLPIKNSENYCFNTNICARNDSNKSNKGNEDQNSKIQKSKCKITFTNTLNFLTATTENLVPNNNKNEYNFSNFSSIHKQNNNNLNSDFKLADQINSFTPIEPFQNKMVIIPKDSDSNLNIPQKINEKVSLLQDN